jgi:potassium efflux system protein
MPAAVTAPLAFAVLSAFGYHYSAMQLQDRLQATAWIVVALIIVNESPMRWLYVKGRNRIVLVLERPYAVRNFFAVLRRRLVLKFTEDRVEWVSAAPESGICHLQDDGRMHRVHGALVIERAAYAVYLRRSGGVDLIKKLLEYFVV